MANFLFRLMRWLLQLLCKLWTQSSASHEDVKQKSNSLSASMDVFAMFKEPMALIACP